jgi:predicted 2-oxoglutarate/Fe(II)-dependent dioxygenase YbiX
MDFIYERDDVLSSALCSLIIHKFENDDNKHVGYVENEKIDETYKKTTDLKMNKYENWREIEITLRGLISNELHRYLEGINLLLGRNETNFDRVLGATFIDPEISALQIQRYKSGEYYNWHIDSCNHSGFCRVLGFILYLNTLGDEDGGETEFINGKKVKPEAGKLMIFPSTWTNIHRGNVIKNGTKYIITGFLYSRIITL